MAKIKKLLRNLDGGFTLQFTGKKDKDLKVSKSYVELNELKVGSTYPPVKKKKEEKKE